MRNIYKFILMYLYKNKNVVLWQTQKKKHFNKNNFIRII